jgi:hypothetical protein
MFENPLSTSTKKTHDNVLIATSKGVPLDELEHSLVPRRYISEHNIKEIVIKKYRSSRKRITFNDV